MTGASRDGMTLARLLGLILLANGSPVLAKRVLPGRFAGPLDHHVRFVDGRPLLGGSKTLRGIAVSLLVTAATAPLFGLDRRTGLIAATAAMAGDLVSSFLKRRLGLSPSTKAVGLDQIPEALLPLLARRPALASTALDVSAGTAIFLVGELMLSRLLFRWHIRDRPY